MKISAINQTYNIFTGIKPSYYKDGAYIYPIEADIDASDIKRIKNKIKASESIGGGLNGDVYKLNDRYVVKRTKEASLVENSTIQEAKKLDMIYDLIKERDVNLENMQKGIAAFKDKDGCFLISTFVDGRMCNYPENPLTEKNIDSIMNILTELDKGSKQNGRLMVYDLNRGNINFTKDKAGIFDIEYMKGCPLKIDIPYRVLSGRNTTTSHISDTSALTSNIGTFEFGCLYRYLVNAPDEIAKDTFKMFLKRKSKYHSDMAEYLSKESGESQYSNVLSDIAEREKIHSRLLGKNVIDTDIIKSEAMKIQISEFLYQTGDPKYRGKINPKQIYDYYNAVMSFFRNSFISAFKKKDCDKSVYYFNCVNLMKMWQEAQKVISTKFGSEYITKALTRTLDKIVL